MRRTYFTRSQSAAASIENQATGTLLQTRQSTRRRHRGADPVVTNISLSPAVQPLSPLAEPRPVQCQECPRVFATIRGLGVHRRRAHPETVNAEIRLPEARRLWREEEMLLMAREEAIATLNGVAHMNVHLQTMMLGRTAQAIAQVRRRAQYKQKVLAAQIDLRAAAQHQVPPLSPPAPGATLSPASETPPAAARRPRRSTIGTNLRGVITNLINIIKASGDKNYNAGALLHTAESALQDPVAVEAGLPAWLATAFPPPAASDAPSSFRRSVGVPLSKKKRRRMEYARIQRAWKKCPTRTAREIINGQTGRIAHSIEELTAYWGEAVGQHSLPYPQAINPNPDDSLAFMWDPISCEEITSHETELSSSAGLDGITPRQWRAVPPQLRALLFNVAMLARGFPKELLRTRTIFLPKIPQPAGPPDYRPISILSVVVRQLHRILAARLLRAPVIDERQRAFIKADGIAENTTILDALLHSAKARREELHIATIDISKAFDTLSHEALLAIVSQLGFPQGFSTYIAQLYTGATTSFQVGGRQSPPVAIHRGVRQGDPLSPYLFNLAVNHALAAIPAEVGFSLDGTKISALAFADDLVLVSSSQVGMKIALTRVEEACASMGLMFNTGKSSTLSLVAGIGRRTTKVIEQSMFHTSHGPLPAVKVLDTWKYLGIGYQTSGAATVESDLKGALERITRAPLKPQQRLCILRVYLVPKVYHALTLGRTTTGRLEALDRQVRQAVRAWLRLPRDVTTGYFHAAVKDGGLGIPALRILIPGLTISRLTQLENSTWAAARAAFSSTRLQHKLRWARSCLENSGLPTEHPVGEDRRRHWAQVLHRSVDGHELRESASCSTSTSWIDKFRSMTPGRDYVQYHHVRVNCLPTLMRTTRGVRRQDRNVNCRAGCGVAETAAHIIQGCFRTHGGRVKRHDALCRTIAEGLQSRGYIVEQEPHIMTTMGLRKPDIIAKKRERGVIIDAQVVSASGPLDEAHRRKVAKYNQPEVLGGVAERLGVTSEDISVTSATLSWRGVWSKDSHDQLRGLGLPEGTLGGLTTRVLQGSHMNWTRWNKFTTMFHPPREGVG